MSVVLIVSLASAARAATHLTETGSTLLYPILTVWIERFGPTHRDVRVEATATGSGVGVASAISGRAQIGGSDAYLSDAQMQTNALLNIPLAVSAQVIVYNVPELRGSAPLHLTGPILAGMYDGSIPNWDDPKIGTANPGRVLPHHAILPIHRTDGSGDTFLFTQFLSLSTPAWDSAVHFGTLVHWPKNPKALEETGNGGVVDLCVHAPYSITYAGISYAERAQAGKLDFAAIQNRSGAFVLPTTEAILSTAEVMAKNVSADGRLSMIYTSGADAYPLVNFEYAIVRAQQVKPGYAVALRSFLNWVVAPDEGNDATLLATVHFAPLPQHVRDIALREISTIAGP